MSKILIRIMQGRIMKRVEEILGEDQFGFRIGDGIGEHMNPF